MTLIQDEQAAADLAALVLDMGMITEKGIVARKLARKVLGWTDGGVAPDMVPVVTNETLRMIPRNEPVFLLRAQDLFAADAVRYWAARVLEKDTSEESKEIVQVALNHAAKMDLWPKKKLPDLPRSSNRFEAFGKFRKMIVQMFCPELVESPDASATADGDR